jgi:hypothetical protein
VVAGVYVHGAVDVAVVAVYIVAAGGSPEIPPIALRVRRVHCGRRLRRNDGGTDHWPFSKSNVTSGSSK